MYIAGNYKKEASGHYKKTAMLFYKISKTSLDVSLVTRISVFRKRDGRRPHDQHIRRVETANFVHVAI